MHPELRISNLHPPDQFLEIIRKGVEVVPLSLKGENGILTLSRSRTGHG